MTGENPKQVRSRSRPQLESSVMPTVNVIPTLVASGFRQILAPGTKIASSAGSSNRVREDISWPRAQSNRVRRRQHPKRWLLQQEFSSPQQRSATDMRRSDSRRQTLWCGPTPSTEINGAAAEVCGASIKVVYSALIDEVQKMLQ